MSILLQGHAVTGLPARWQRDVPAGVLVGLLSALFAVSHAALIFNGELAPWLPVGIVGGVLACIGMLLAHAVAGSVPYGIGATDSSSISILAVIVGGAVAALPAETLPETRLATAIGCITVSVALAGLALVGFGVGRVGRVARFLPYPVIGGFMGGSGALVLKGAASFLDVDPAGLSTLSMSSPLVPQWGVALAGTVALWIAGRSRQGIAVPVTIIVLALVTHAVLAMAGIGITEARQTGWLPPQQETHLPEWPLLLLRGFDPWLMLGQAGNVLALTLIVILSVLMHASGIEVQTQEPVDIDRELTASGIGNLLVAALGGIGGNLSLSRTVMAHQFGARGRATGIAAAAACAVLLAAALPLLSYLPRPILGAMLLQVGLMLVKSWTVDAAFRLSRLDYLLVLALIVIIASAGFVPGIVIGLVIASLIFVVSYSRTPVVRYAPTLADHRSGTDRPFHHRRLLDQHGAEGWVLCLQGFLFFGTASSMLQLVADRLARPDLTGLRVLVVDFRLVTGIDASAAFAFLKLIRLTRDKGVRLIYSSAVGTLEQTLASVSLGGGEAADALFQPALDRAIEVAEDAIVAAHIGGAPPVDLAEDAMAAILEDPEERRLFRAALERFELPAGMVVIQQGQQATDLFILGRGRVTVTIDSQGTEKRLRTLGPGSIVGEIGMLLGERRTASVICDDDCVLYRLSSDAFATLRRDQPAVADRFYCYVIRVISDRLVHANRALDRLLG